MKVFLGLGSNIGDKQDNLKRTIALLSEFVDVIKKSSVYETEPIGYKEQDDFVNMVVEVTTRLTPEELLFFVKEIEKKMGRKKTFVDAPRIIDIDILLYGDEIINETHLQIPHLRMHERRFVLLPFAEIAPNIVHPVKKRKIHELLLQIPLENQTAIRC